jgi:hypothetical protein
MRLLLGQDFFGQLEPGVQGRQCFRHHRYLLIEPGLATVPCGRLAEGQRARALTSS